MQQNDCANPRERRCRLGDFDAELEQLAMDLGGSPQWVLEAHSSDQERHFSGNPRPAPRRTGPPSPVGGKALSMPPHDSFGPDDRYRVKNARPMPVKPNEQHAVYPAKMQSTTLPPPLKNIELMAQYRSGQSLFPGNEILPAETEGPQRRPKSFWSSLGDRHSHADARQIGAILRESGKFPETADCVVGPGGLEPPTRPL
jgi:hypothetical protein